MARGAEYACTQNDSVLNSGLLTNEQAHVWRYLLKKSNDVQAIVAMLTAAHMGEQSCTPAH